MDPYEGSAVQAESKGVLWGVLLPALSRPGGMIPLNVGIGRPGFKLFTFSNETPNPQVQTMSLGMVDINGYSWCYSSLVQHPITPVTNACCLFTVCQETIVGTVASINLSQFRGWSCFLILCPSRRFSGNSKYLIIDTVCIDPLIHSFLQQISSTNALWLKTTRNRPVVEQVELITCCSEGESSPQTIWGVSRRNC